MSNTKVCTTCSLEKPLDAFYKDKTKKDGYRTDCKVCRIATSKAYADANRDSVRQRKNEYYHRNKERILNCEVGKERRRQSSKEWKERNPEKARHHRSVYGAKRRATKLNATPAWANQDKINYVYYCRDVVNRVYGGNCEVDHIVPLQGKHVCGLHVHNNLQLLSAKANRSKGARQI